MTLDDFRQSLTETEPPTGLTHALDGLWWDGKGDWKRAHESAQQDEDTEGSWVHAYLHRKEGDQGNAVGRTDPIRVAKLNLSEQLLLLNTGAGARGGSRYAGKK